MCTLSPERGLRPIRGGRRLIEKLPKPRISIRWPRTSASLIASRMVLTAYSASRWVSWLKRAASSSTRSLRVIRRQGRRGHPCCSLLVLVVQLGAQQGAQAGRAGLFAGRLLLQVGHRALLVQHVLLLDGQLDVAGLA